MISEYSKYVPLERPNNEDLRYFVQEMSRVNNRIEQNAATLQAYTDQLAGTDIIRSSDKQYFDSKMSQTVSELSNLGALNFNSTATVLKAKKALGNVLNDSRIKNAIVETANVRKVMSQWEKVRTDPKLAANWNDKNYGLDMLRINDYISSEDPNAKLGLSNATLYNGEFEKLQKLGRETKASTEEFIGGYKSLTKVTRQEISKTALRSNFDNVTGLDGVLRNHFQYDMRSNPNFAKALKSALPSMKKNLKDYISMLEAEEKINSSIQTTENGEQYYKGIPNLLVNEINYKKTQLRALENLSELPESEALFHLYKEMKKDEHVNTFYNVNQKTSVNTVAQQQFTLSLAAEKLGLDKSQFNLSKSIAQHKINQDIINNEFKQKELDLAAEKLKIDAFEAANKSNNSTRTNNSTNRLNTGSGSSDEVVGTDFNAFNATFDLEGEVVANSGREWFEKTYSDVVNSYNTEIRGLFSFINTLSETNKEVVKGLQEKLSPLGLGVDELSRNSKMTPKKLQALQTALESYFYSDIDMPNSVKDQIGGHLIKLTDLSNMAEVYNMRAKMVKDYALTKGPEGSKEYEKAVNELMDNQGQIYSNKKGIALSSIMDENTSKSVPMRNVIKTIVDNAETFYDSSGGAWYTSDIDPKTGKSTGNRRISIDHSKISVIGIDPQKERIVVNIPIKEGDNTVTRKMYIAADGSVLRQASEIVSPGLYDQVKNMSLGIEELLTKTNSFALRDAYAQKIQTTGGFKLGLPSFATLLYRLEVLETGQPIFYIKNDKNEEKSLNRFTSIADLENKFRQTYQAFYLMKKKDNPDAAEKQIQLMAYKQALKTLTE